MKNSIDVYVPTGDLFGIARASGIVGTMETNVPDDFSPRLLIDYEGRLYEQANIVTFADRVMQAWGRHAVRYPTVARLSVPPAAMWKVATFVPDVGRVYVEEAEHERVLLQEWLTLDVIPESELEVSHGRAT